MRNKVIFKTVVLFLTLAMGLAACSPKAAATATQLPAAKATNTQPPATQATNTQMPASQVTNTQPPAVQATNTQPPPAQATNTLPPANTATLAPAGADGATLLNQRCSVCHSPDRVKLYRLSADQWTQVVSFMVQNGAKLTSDEQKVLVAYLAKTYGP